jgi:geranylgeranyl diphosphate synthase type II
VCVAEAISILAAVPQDTRAELVRFGLSLGMLYQICDDIRAIWCEPEALGRQIGRDICQQRASLPLLYAFSQGSAPLRGLLAERLAGAEAVSSEDLAYVRHELTACGVQELCHRDATRFYKDAQDALEALRMYGPEVRVLHGILATCFESVQFRA